MLGLALGLSGWGAEVAPRVALVIGNARYEAAVGPLKNPVNDARAVAKVLRSLGFTVAEEHNATRDAMLEAVGAFRGRARGAEVALFYYAGHGVSVGGANYLIPIKSGYDPAGADGVALRMLAETRLFNAGQVVAEMSASGSRCNLVILDACRNTPVARDPQVRDAAGVGGLSEMKPPAGSLIAFATDAGLTAQDGEGANGLYTGALLKHLASSGLTIEQVFKRTREEVMERSGGRQIPAEYSRLVGEDIYLAGAVEGAGGMVERGPKAAKAEPVTVPSVAEIQRLGASGEWDRSFEAMELRVASVGREGSVVVPLDGILEKIKEELKEEDLGRERLEGMMADCVRVLAAVRDFLPAGHGQADGLIAKGQNRRGDCLLRLGRAEEALSAYEVAGQLAPGDAYPVFNRGMALLALGRVAEAKGAFERAASDRYRQPKARQLAREQLKALEGAEKALPVEP